MTAERRRPAGAAVMQPQVTEAITEAVLAELAEVGYGRLSMEAVARRAGVSKPTVYRRWRSKEEMVAALASTLAVAAAETPDTGTLRGDVLAYLESAAGMLSHPLASRVIPDLLAEASRNPALAQSLLIGARDTRRERAADMLRRAIARGELPAELNIDLALDVLAGPLYWRLMIVGIPIEPDYVDRLTDLLIAGWRG
ncbi:TetR/AcrR family transcriptional regulator [Nocardia beijingensis]|uniref:TetR/AcrR family transcriptional regulator n=1 Tax=Nocardia beijingensis TaxID=95162 RepID=A0ABW7WIP2_9NOCA